MKPATLHRGKTWWIIPKGAAGFVAMRSGFPTAAAARQWAEASGFIITEES
jgi:hypothetical protein